MKTLRTTYLEQRQLHGIVRNEVADTDHICTESSDVLFLQGL